jgi:hypothetical protein
VLAVVCWCCGAVVLCCGAVDAVGSVGVVGAGRLGFLGRPVLHLQNYFILPLWFLLA